MSATATCATSGAPVDWAAQVDEEVDRLPTRQVGPQVHVAWHVRQPAVQRHRVAPRITAEADVSASSVYRYFGTLQLRRHGRDTPLVPDRLHHVTDRHHRPTLRIVRNRLPRGDQPDVHPAEPRQLTLSPALRVEDHGQHREPTVA